MESVLLFVKIFGTLGVTLLLAGLKYLHSILKNSQETKTEFHTFKSEFREELVGVKHQLERVSDKIKDSFSKSETNNLLLQLENKLQTKIYDLFNTHQQKLNNKNNTTKD